MPLTSFKYHAEQGHADCQYALAVLLLDKHDGNDKEAVEWLQKSAAQGHASAQLKLGICFELGIGYDEDQEKALEYYRKAATYNQHDRFHIQDARKAKLRLEGKIAFAKKDYFWAEVSKSKKWYLDRIPDIVDQQKGYCGLAAFAEAASNSGYLSKPIYASLHEKKQSGSLEYKDNSDVLLYQLTGNPDPVDYPIYDVDLLEKLADKVGVPGKAVKLSSLCTEEEYSKRILEALNNHYALILSCECGDDDMPMANSGRRTHWVLCFGYWVEDDNNYKLAVTHHGKYCIWSLCDLYKSNQQLPYENPLIEEGKLDKFRFTFFKMPTRSRCYLDRPELPQSKINDIYSTQSRIQFSI